MRNSCVAMVSGAGGVPKVRFLVRPKIHLKLNPETFSDREDLSSRHQQAFGKTSVKSILEDHRDHVLAEATSEIMKQECKVFSLNTCTRELQRQAYSQRLGLDDAICGYEESQREQVRLEEELALERERAHRNICIRNIHEMEELRRVQDDRVDEIKN